MATKVRYTVEGPVRETEHPEEEQPFMVNAFYVRNESGRRCRRFIGKDARRKAGEWAAYLEENLV